jgi:TPR repeat protein
LACKGRRSTQESETLAERPNAKQRIRAFLAAGVLAVLSSGGASSGTLDDAIAASKRGDKAAALQLFKAAADQGDSVGQLIVGGIYEDGTVVPRNCGESQKWLHKAADQDLTAQQTTDAKFAVVAARQELAHLYGWDGGFCVTRDVAESGKWALKAAEGGELRGLIELVDQI